MPSLATLIVQIAVVLVAARGVGWIFRRIHQPQVMGEMVAGILLGPSLLGWVAPGVSAALFPPDSLGFLSALSQVGLLLFMFLIGLELDPKLLRGRGHAALVTSHVSIVAPFFLGSALALYLYPRLSDDSVTFTGFALFMGAAMSITAFPVLARILTERNLLRSRVGAITLACAAVDDVTAWCILAGVIALVRAADVQIPLWLTLAGSATYIGVMLFGARPALRRLEAYYHSRGRLTQDMMALVLLLVLASAWATEWLGIHALFGAFALGAIMPKDRGFVHDLTERLEDVTVVFLLPLFFAFTGLRTSIGLVSGVEMWGYTLLIVAVAVVGKFGGSTLAARVTGLSWREAGALGVLMNTRGLMELVILNIGLEIGVISPALFAMMVLMALVTTFMTTPLLERIYPARLIRREVIAADGEEEAYTVVLPVALPSYGPRLLQMAAALAPPPESRLYALHLIRAGEQSLMTTGGDALRARNEALQPLLESADRSGVRVRPLSFVSHDPGEDIVAVAHAKGADMILMGWHKPVISRSILSGTVHTVLQRARADVAVYVERQPGPWRRVLVPFIGGAHDRAALELARRLAARGETEVTILHVVGPNRPAGAPRLGASTAVEAAGADHASLKVVPSDDALETAVQEARRGYDLVIIGVSGAWGLESSTFGLQHERLALETASSLLIVRKYSPSPETPRRSAAVPVGAARTGPTS